MDEPCWRRPWGWWLRTEGPADATSRVLVSRAEPPGQRGLSAHSRKVALRWEVSPSWPRAPSLPVWLNHSISLSRLPLLGPLHHPHPSGHRIQDKFPPLLSPQLCRCCCFLPWLLHGELAASPRGREAGGWGHLARIRERSGEMLECVLSLALFCFLFFSLSRSDVNPLTTPLPTGLGALPSPGEASEAEQISRWESPGRLPAFPRANPGRDILTPSCAVLARPGLF